MCPRPNRPRRARAFTLVELMVSLLLLGIVLTLVYGSFAQISGAATQLETRLEQRQELRLLLKLIADDLRAVQWLEQFAKAGEGRTSGIVGERDFVEAHEFSRLAFHAAEPARFHREVGPAGDPGLHEIGYHVRAPEADDGLGEAGSGGDGAGDGVGFELVRREDFYLDDRIGEGGLEVAIADRIETFRVEYLPPDAPPTEAGESWDDRWDSARQPAEEPLPKALRLTLGRRTAGDDVLEETLEFNLALQP